MRLDTLEINEFRGIKNLKLKQLKNVNLLLGDNDAGKTSVLEAISMFEMPGEIDSIIRNSRIRISNARISYDSYYTPLESLMHLFPFDQESKHLEIRAVIDGHSETLKLNGELEHVLKTITKDDRRKMLGAIQRKYEGSTEREALTFRGVLKYDAEEKDIEIDDTYTYRIPVLSSMKGRRPVSYLTPGDHLSGRQGTSIFRTSRKEELEIVALLRLIDPEIEGFKLQPNEIYGGTNKVIEHSRFGNVPLYTYGDGLKKIFTLASGVIGAKNGILMIDEIETSLQASNLTKVFTWLLSACKMYDVQLFITTHSLESIASLVSCAVENTASELSCYRLEKDYDQVYAKRFAESELDDMVNGRGIDVR